MGKGKAIGPGDAACEYVGGEFPMAGRGNLPWMVIDAVAADFHDCQGCA